jgi:hypothetical protein
MLYSFLYIYNQRTRMKPLLFSALLGLGIFSLTGCGEEQKPQPPAMKCEPGKCGEGKCGDK